MVLKNHFIGSLIRRYLRYHDGDLYWNVLKGSLTRIEKRHNTLLSGRVAGCSTHWSGYIYVTLKGVQYPAHSIVWYLNTGDWCEIIDHKDRNRANNNIANLRKADSSENACNSKMSSRNTSGVRGVSWNKVVGKWKVRVTKAGKDVFGGYYNDLEEAKHVADNLRGKLHGEYKSQDERSTEHGENRRKRTKKPAGGDERCLQWDSGFGTQVCIEGYEGYGPDNGDTGSLG